MKMENQITTRSLPWRRMINSLRFIVVLTFLHLYSCTGQTFKEEQIPLGTTFYWEKNSTEKFLALNFLSSPKIVCNLYQLGINTKNKKMIAEISRLKHNKFAFHDTLSNTLQGTVEVVSDSTIVLSLTDIPETFKMIADKSQERLFNHMKSKFSLGCIQSSDISFNGIIAHETSVTPFLNKEGFKNRNETITDEVYGSTELQYLEFGLNKFYYISRGAKKIFDKIEIVSNNLDSSFLNIRIGDTRQEVLQKMKLYEEVLRLNDLSITATVCNQAFIGHDGFITFKFKKVNADSLEIVLEKIIYQPLTEGE